MSLQRKSKNNKFSGARFSVAAHYARELRLALGDDGCGSPPGLQAALFLRVVSCPCACWPVRHAFVPSTHSCAHPRPHQEQRRQQRLQRCSSLAIMPACTTAVCSAACAFLACSSCFCVCSAPPAAATAFACAARCGCAAMVRRAAAARRGAARCSAVQRGAVRAAAVVGCAAMMGCAAMRAHLVD